MAHTQTRLMTLLALCLIGAQLACADDFSAQREAVLALGELTAPPAWHEAEGPAGEAGLTAIYFDALDYRGKPTKVFAWLGFPGNFSGTVPGVVLVHGGGGTAFQEWVRLWTAKGFAALSIAVEGQTDARDVASKGQDNPSGWKPHPWAGPRRIGIYGDSGEPLKDQWMYHAVADTVLANSLLRSLPEVDADKVGLMGISWGGVIASTVIGIDPRFSFAIPTYGCGHLYDDPNQYGKALGDNPLYREVWDPMVRMDRAQMPVLWLSWPEDQHFALDCQAACYRAAPGLRMVSLIPGMKHGHGAAWNPPDSYAFAESIVQAGKPWCTQTSVKLEDGTASCEFTSTRPLDQAVLVATTETGFTGGRRWIQLPAQLSEAGKVWRITAPLPEGTTAWFINVHSDGLTVSSEFQEPPRRQ